MDTFRYTLDSSEKFDCPECGHHKRFVRYMDVTDGSWVEGDYGKCDRENSCGYWRMVDNNAIVNDDECVEGYERREKSLFAEEYLKYEFHYEDFKRNDYLIDKVVKQPYRLDRLVSLERIPNTQGRCRYINPFMRGIRNRFGGRAAKTVYDEFDLATFHDGGVIFPYFDYPGNLLTGKIMFYDHKLKRIREGPQSKYLWLHSGYYEPSGIGLKRIYTIEDYTPDMSLFHYSRNLIQNKELFGLVESEKTAIILSIVVPEIHWFATGGLNNLQPYKFLMLNNKWFAVLPDLGILPKRNITVQQYWEEKIQVLRRDHLSESVFEFIDYIPPNLSSNEGDEAVAAGSDVADFILKDDGYIPWIREKILKTIP